MSNKIRDILKKGSIISVDHNRFNEYEVLLVPTVTDRQFRLKKISDNSEITALVNHLQRLYDKKILVIKHPVKYMEI